MVGLINLANGLSQMGQSIAASGLEGQKDALENQRMTLASQLEEGRQGRLAAQTHGYELENIGATGTQARETAQTTAEAQGGQQRQTAGYVNTLPMTAAETADVAVRNRQAGASEMSARASQMEAEKPVPGGFTGSFMVRDQTAPGGWKLTSVGDTGAGPADQTSTSLIGQTGLSQAAIDWLTKGARPRGQMQYNMTQKEINDFSRKTGVDTSTLEAQAKAQNAILESNIKRNSQGTTLENEIQGSVSNLAPMLDAAHRGTVRFANTAEGWVSQQANNPQATAIADQLNRFRAEVAGYNAVAGGHLMQNGTPEPTPDDFRKADQVLSSGINSGSIKAISDSVGMSAAKNRAVLGKSVDDASRSMWNLFGVGERYKDKYVGETPAPAGTSFPTPPPAAIQELKARGAGATAHFDQIFGRGAADRVLGSK